MKMNKNYRSVLEMVKDLSINKDFQREFAKEVSDKRLSKTLFAMRCSRGLTQAEMATLMGCTQSRLSKLENSSMDSIKVADLVAYAKALKLGMSIQFHEEMTLVESVKFHSFEIQKNLGQLAELAHRDDALFEGVKKFYTESLINILTFFEESAKKLPAKSRKKRKPTLEVIVPGDSPRDMQLAER